MYFFPLCALGRAGVGTSVPVGSGNAVQHRELQQLRQQREEPVSRSALGRCWFLWQSEGLMKLSLLTRKTEIKCVLEREGGLKHFFYTWCI